MHSVRIIEMTLPRDMLDHVSTPGRYLPLELNVRGKDLERAEVKAALAFPDLYEVGMSHLGVGILYHLMNDLEWTACERAFAPWTDMESLMRAKQVPLVSMESQVPLSKFDLLGFSLTYELCYTNVLNMLDLAGIPLFAKDREQDGWPLVIGGGPCASNPEPVAPFFDAFLFGDGEDAVPEMCGAIREWKQGRGDKRDLLSRLALIEGVYVPSFFEPVYNEDGAIKEIRLLQRGCERVKRRVVSDLDSAYFPGSPLAPVIEPVHDRLMVEIARGCTRGCRFCHAGSVCRPARERSPEKVRELVSRGLAATGYEEASLLSLSAGDYTCLPELVMSLVKEHYKNRVSISLPSLRVQGIPDEVLKAMQSVRKTGFTLAPEAGTERLRRVINKDYSEDDLLGTAQRVFSQGWRNLKLYFMAGLPDERDEDIEGILETAWKVSKIKGSNGRPQVTVSIGGFVPKPHTPFQWEAQAGVERLKQVQQRVRRGFSGKGKRVRWHDPWMSRLEGVFSRGDRRLAPVLVRAWRRGARFDGWSEMFNHARWDEAFAEEGIEPEYYTRERDREEVFPWEHLDSRVGREWLWNERERAYNREMTPDCRDAGCQSFCGACDFGKIKNSEADEEPFEKIKEPLPYAAPQPRTHFLYRVQYAKRGDMRFMGQLEVTRLFGRATRRAGLPMRYSEGFHQKPRIMFGPAPPLGVASEAEYIDLELLRRLPEEGVKTALGGEMPEGVEIKRVQELPAKAPAVTSAISDLEYLVSPANGLGFPEDKIKRFMDRDSLLITQKREKGDREVDVRSLVKYLAAEDDGSLRMGIKRVEGPGVKPQEVIKCVFGMDEEEVRNLEIIKTRARFKKPSPVRYPGRSERARKPGGRRRS